MTPMEATIQASPQLRVHSRFLYPWSPDTRFAD